MLLKQLAMILRDVPMRHSFLASLVVGMARLCTRPGFHTPAVAHRLWYA
jgi:hypothetical protein